MASLNITEDNIPSLNGKVVIITGGCSGIGLAAARIFASRGAKVHALDLNPIDKNSNNSKGCGGGNS